MRLQVRDAVEGADALGQVTVEGLLVAAGHGGHEVRRAGGGGGERHLWVAASASPTEARSAGRTDIQSRAS